MNMFAANLAHSIQDYIANVPEGRREVIKFLDDLIRKTVPTLKPHYAQNMLGYGSFPYIDYKKREGTWPVIALANQKNYISVYVCAVDGNEYLAEKYKRELGKVSVGKSCIRFKKIDDVHIATLKKVFKEAEKNPGFANTKK